jgi:hypothetical protein
MTWQPQLDRRPCKQLLTRELVADGHVIFAASPTELSQPHRPNGLNMAYTQKFQQLADTACSEVHGVTLAPVTRSDNKETNHASVTDPSFAQSSDRGSDTAAVRLLE